MVWNLFADNNPYQTKLMKRFNKPLITISLLCFGMAAGAATLDPKVLNNIHLGPDPEILPFQLRAQVAPHITRSFSDPTLLRATWQSGKYSGSFGSVGSEYAVSRDGGLTWVRNFVPALTQGIDSGPFERASQTVGAISFAMSFSKTASFSI